MKRWTCRDFTELLDENSWKNTVGGFGLPADQAEAAAALASPERLERLSRKLNSLELRLLKLLLSRPAGQLYAPDELAHGQLDGAVQGHVMTSAEIRTALAGLQAKLIVLACRSGWGEYQVFLPADTLRSWLGLAYPEIEEMIREALGGAAEADMLEESAEGIGADMLRLLVYADKHGLRLTREGRVHARQLKELKAVLGFPPELLLELADSMGLLARGAQDLRLKKDRAAQWLNWQPEWREQTLYRAWCDHSGPERAAAQHGQALLELAPPGQWFLLKPLSRWLEMLHGGGAGEELESLARSLNALGWLEEGRTPQGEPAFRWSQHPLCGPETTGYADGRETLQSTLYVKPDFEAVLLPAAPASLRWLLEWGARPAKAGGSGSLYRLERDTFQTACRLGLAAERFVERLEQGSACGLPDNVRTALMRWAKDAAGEKPATRAIALELPETVTVAGKREWSASAGEQTRRRVRPAGLSAFLPDPAAAEPSRLFEGLEEIPVAWLYRSMEYHAATRRKILETALQQGTHVVLWRSGSPVRFIPQTIEEQEGRWKVRGVENDRTALIGPEEWKEMQLVIPGINDQENSASGHHLC